MEIHHLVWLNAHPERDIVWLECHLQDGFDVHHLDGNGVNNTPENLVLIECVDHLRLHGATKLSRLRSGPPKSGRPIADLLEMFNMRAIDDMFQCWLTTNSYKKTATEFNVTVVELRKLFRRYQKEKLGKEPYILKQQNVSPERV